MSYVTKYIVLIFLLFNCSDLIGGQYWEKVDVTPAQYNNNHWLDVYFLESNPNYGWMCGFGGRVMRTTDRGNSWYGVTIQNINHLESIHFATQNIGYTSGASGIFKTTDGGLTWTDVSPAGLTESWGNYFIDEDNGILVGGGCNGIQNFWRTTDGGQSWNHFTSNQSNSGLTDAIIFENNGLALAVSSGELWISNDGGFTWSILADTGLNFWQEELTVSGNSILLPYAGNSCSGAGANGGLRFSTDNGISWNDFNTGTSMYGAFLIDQQKAWGCGNNAAVYYTSNAGNTWEEINCGIKTSIDDLWFITENEGWAVGIGIYKLVNGYTDISEDTLDYEEICYPGEKVDTFFVYNHDFENRTFNLDLLNDASDAFDIVDPVPSNFNLNPCDSMMVIVQYKPNYAGRSLGSIEIFRDAFFAGNIRLIGNSAETFATFSKDTLIIDNAFCGSISIDSIYWNAQEYDDSIIEVEKLDEDPITFDGNILPAFLDMYGIYTKFFAEPVDTGWIESQFLFILNRCDREEKITVRAYGVSPIINASESIRMNAICTDEIIDTLEISNTGNHDLIISSLEIINGSGFEIIGWLNKNISDTIPPEKSNYLIIRYSGMDQMSTAQLVLNNNDLTSVRGDKSRFVIDLRAEMQFTELSFSNNPIDLGRICYGKDLVINTDFSSIGNADIESLEYSFENNSFVIESAPADLKTGENGTLTIKQKDPDLIGEISDKLIIEFEPCGGKVELDIRGFVIFTDLEINNENYNVYLLKSNSEKISIEFINNGNTKISISDLEMDQSISDKLSILTSLPVNIEPQESKNIEIQIDAIEIGNFNGSIIPVFESECDLEKKIELSINISDKDLILSENRIDFATIICDTKLLESAIEIRNNGSFADTIRTISLSPHLNEITYVSDLLPIVLEPDSSTKITISYLPLQPKEIFSELIINEGRNEHRVPIEGAFKKPVISEIPQAIDLGVFEVCDEPVWAFFVVSNSGNLTEIFDLKTSNLIDVLPGSFEVLPDSTVEITAILDPSNISSYGKGFENIIFEAQHCPDTLAVKVEYEALMHEFTLSDNSFDLGDIVIDQLRSGSFEITNTGDVDLIIEDISSTNEDLNIKKNTPFELKTGIKEMIIFEISSSVKGSFNEQILIKASSICKSEKYITVTANIIDKLHILEFIIPDKKAKPGDTLDLEIILVKSNNELKLDEAIFEIEFAEYLFYPFFASTTFSDFIDIKRISENTFRIKINDSGTSDIFKYEGSILNVTGLALGGNPTETEVKLTDLIVNTSGRYDYIVDDGILKLDDFCPPPIEGSIYVTVPLVVDIISSPDKIQIISEGRISSLIKLFNTSGELIYNELINLEKGVNQFDINSIDLSSGKYYIELKTQFGQKKNGEIIILK